MENISKILNEISQLVPKIDSKEINVMIDYIQQAKHIFLAGAGRSGVMIDAYANRLMHLGLSVSVVGEITSPHSTSNDLMIIGSGSGETVRLVNQAKLAKKNGVKIILITANTDSTLAKLADCIVRIPFNTIPSIQPMGSLFEQTSFLLYDCTILCLMAKRNETAQSMKARHADIE